MVEWVLASTDPSVRLPCSLVARGDHWHYADKQVGLSVNWYRTSVLLVQGLDAPAWDDHFAREREAARAATTTESSAGAGRGTE